MAATRRGEMPLHERAQLVSVRLIGHRLEQDRLAVDLAGELALRIIDERGAVGHARAEVGAGRAENDNQAAGHVLATVVANALDNRRGAAVADTEALSSATGREQSAPGRAVEDRIAGDRLWRVEWSRRRGPDGNLAAGHSFADVVIGLAFEIEAHTVNDERAETLTSATGQPDQKGAV